MNSTGPFVLKNRIFVIFIFVATLFMSIGYASINSIILEFNGEVRVYYHYTASIKSITSYT